MYIGVCKSIIELMYLSVIMINERGTVTIV